MHYGDKQMMESLLAEIRANNEKAQVLRGTLVFRMDDHQAIQTKDGSPDGR
jgi:hypothetical protein